MRQRDNCGGRCWCRLSARGGIRNQHSIRTVGRRILCGKCEDWLGKASNVPNGDDPFAVARNAVRVKRICGNAVDLAGRLRRGRCGIAKIVELKPAVRYASEEKLRAVRKPGKG